MFFFLSGFLQVFFVAEVFFKLKPLCFQKAAIYERFFSGHLGASSSLIEGSKTKHFFGISKNEGGKKNNESDLCSPFLFFQKRPF